jgi:fibronectin type 3 domain-containing protein
MIRRGIALIGVLALLFLGGCSDKSSDSIKLGYIEGNVTLDGIGVSGVEVSVSAYDFTDGGPAKISESDAVQGTGADGDYSIDLLPGQYRVDYSLYYFGLRYDAARYPVVVAGDAHVHIDVELKNPAPTNLIAQDENTSVYLTFYKGYWVDDYRIYRAAGTGGDFELIETIFGNNTIISYRDQPPQVGYYRYKVTGLLDGNIETSFSNEADVNFTATIAPPSYFTASDNLTNVELYWSRNQYAIYYKIYRAAGTGAWSLLDSIASQTYVDIPSSYNTYKYRVTAVSAFRTESVPTAEQTINYDGRLEPPAGLNVVDQGAILYLSWNQSGHDSQYNIYRSLVSNDNFVKIDSTDNFYYSDRPPAGHTYYYRVSAVASNGLESSLSQVISAAYDGLLEPPEDAVINDYGLYVSLRWVSVPYAGAYILYRSDDGGTVFNQIGRVSGSIPIYQDIPLTGGDKFYKIATETTDGVVGPLSQPYLVHFTNNLLAPANLSAQNLGLRTLIEWQGSNGASRYAIYRATHADGVYAVISDNVSSFSIQDEPSIAGAYYYRVVAKDDIGHESPMSEYAYVYFTNYPEPPTEVSAMDQNVYVNVTWSEVAGVSAYILCKSRTANGDYIVVDTTDATSAIDWPSEAGHYYYKIISLEGVRASEFSNFAHVYFTGNLEAPHNVNGSDNGSSVILNWIGVEYAVEYDVYRGADTNHMILNQTVYTPTASDTPDSAGSYYYGIVARTQGGLESPMSTPILVQFTP